MDDREFEDVANLVAPGWDAIDSALTGLYGTQSPTHVGYDPPPGVSANLQGCSAYRAPDHWHFVTYGLSELYEAGPDSDPSVSGWGLELTMRVALDGPDLPQWPFTMINEIAKQVNRGAMLPEPGGRIDLRAPVTGFPEVPGAPDSGLTVFAITPDPELDGMETSNGRVNFLQLVGVSDAERDGMLATSTEQVLTGLRMRNNLLITDPARVAAPE